MKKEVSIMTRAARRLAPPLLLLTAASCAGESHNPQDAAPAKSWFAPLKQQETFHYPPPVQVTEPQQREDIPALAEVDCRSDESHAGQFRPGTEVYIRGGNGRGTVVTLTSGDTPTSVVFSSGAFSSRTNGENERNQASVVIAEGPDLLQVSAVGDPYALLEVKCAAVTNLRKMAEEFIDRQIGRHENTVYVRTIDASGKPRNGKDAHVVYTPPTKAPSTTQVA